MINARARRALGAIFSKRMPSPSACRAPARPSWRFLRPFAAQGLTSIDFVAPQGHFENRPIFGTPQHRPRGWQSRPLAALWPPRAPFGILSGSILEPIFHHIFYVFPTPSKPCFCITLQYFCMFYASKQLSFKNPFSISFSTPFWDPPVGRAFWPFLAPKVPT